MASRPEMDNDHPRQRSAKAKRTREGFRTRWHAKHESFVDSNGGRVSSSGLVAAIEQEERPCQREGRKVKAQGEDSLGVLGILCPASVQKKARVRCARDYELRDSFDARRCRLSGWKGNFLSLGGQRTQGTNNTKLTSLGAVVLVVVVAVLAREAARDLGSDSDEVADLELGDVGSDLGDLANDLKSAREALASKLMSQSAELDQEDAPRVRRQAAREGRPKTISIESSIDRSRKEETSLSKGMNPRASQPSPILR